MESGIEYQTYSANVTPQILPMPFIDISAGIISSLAFALSFFQKLHGKGGNHVSIKSNTISDISSNEPVVGF
jgi:hypothetical protein